MLMICCCYVQLLANYRSFSLCSCEPHVRWLFTVWIIYLMFNYYSPLNLSYVIIIYITYSDLYWLLLCIFVVEPQLNPLNWTSAYSSFYRDPRHHLAALDCTANSRRITTFSFLWSFEPDESNNKVWILQMPRLSQHPHVLHIESDTPQFTWATMWLQLSLQRDNPTPHNRLLPSRVHTAERQAHLRGAPAPGLHAHLVILPADSPLTSCQT